MLETVETVKKEREHNSNELSLVNYAQNTAVIKATILVVIVTFDVVFNGEESTRAIDVSKEDLYKRINRTTIKRMDCIAMKICYIVRPFCAYKVRF